MVEESVGIGSEKEVVRGPGNNGTSVVECWEETTVKGWRRREGARRC